MKIIIGFLLQFGVAWIVRANPPVVFRATPPTLYPSESPSTVPTRPVASTEATILTPGVYTCVPFSMIVIVPASMDPGIVIHPDEVPPMQIVQPPLTFVPLQRPVPPNASLPPSSPSPSSSSSDGTKRRTVTITRHTVTKVRILDKDHSQKQEPY